MAFSGSSFSSSDGVISPAKVNPAAGAGDELAATTDDVSGDEKEEVKPVGMPSAANYGTTPADDAVTSDASFSVIPINRHSSAPSVTTPLMRKGVAKSDVIPIPLKDRVLIRTGSFGLNSLFLASYFAATGKFLAMLGTEGAGAAAGAITTPFQAVFLGTNVGILLATGFAIGPPIGAKDYKKAGHIAKASWALTAGLGTISSAAMFAIPSVLPLLFEKQTAKIAGDFFYGYALIGIPTLMLITSPQIAFQASDWYVPPVASFAFMVIGGIASYSLAFPAGLGALGVGLGGTIGGSLTCIPLQAWFTKKHYKEYELYQRPIADWGDHTKNLLKSGWKLSAQRLTEWGNLAIITTIIGASSNKALTASQPSNQYIGLLAITIQGFAQATGMIISRNKGAINEATEKFLQSHEESYAFEAQKLHKNNVYTLTQNNIASVLLSGVIATSFYFGREPLAQFFLPSPIDSEITDAAETLLWINMIGLIPDAIRLVSGGALRSWNDILYPTIVGLITMTMLGIMAGWGFSKLFDLDEAESMFWARNIAMAVASCFIVNRCHSQIKKDDLALPKLEAELADGSGQSSRTGTDQAYLPPSSESGVASSADPAKAGVGAARLVPARGYDPRFLAASRPAAGSATAAVAHGNAVGTVVQHSRLALSPTP
ncbi:MAG TPA: MATE family efflux transporter [Candidatus Saccharimonadales bacterium]|nr:MATE family efflux transporter [Candidatus Saccharimonadales bacterium]